MNILPVNNYYTSYSGIQTSSPSFTHSHVKSNLEPKKKAVVLGSAIAGMTPVLAFIAHKKGFSLNPLKIIKTPVKDWALFKYKPKNSSIQFEEAEIIGAGAGSIAGGFIGGAVADDRHNLKAKQREIMNQMLGNILVPVGCVGLGSRIYGKNTDIIEGAMPQLKGSSKSITRFNKCLRKLPNAACTITFLGIGIYLGNKVSNFINDKIYHKKIERHIKITDFAPHVDDLCMAASMMNKESTFGAKLGRIIPLALIVPGYQTGIAQK